MNELFFIWFFDSKHRGWVFRFRANPGQVKKLSKAVSDWNIRTGHTADNLTTIYAGVDSILGDLKAKKGSDLRDWSGLRSWVRETGKAYDVETNDLIDYVANDKRPAEDLPKDTSAAPS